MTEDLFDALLPASAPTDRVHGVVVGIVTNNDDPDGLGRVRVRFPWLSQDDESWWARLAAPMAGPDRGAFFLPEVDDEVLVAFEHGDLRFPYVLGALWNGKDAPPEGQPTDGGKVVRRVLKSRSGHLVRLDDTDGAEKIEIVDKSGKNSLTFDTGANSVTLRADGDILIDSANGSVLLRGKAIEVSSTAEDVTVHSGAALELTATGQSTLKGSTVNIN